MSDITMKSVSDALDRPITAIEALMLCIEHDMDHPDLDDLNDEVSALASDRDRLEAENKRLRETIAALEGEATAVYLAGHARGREAGIREAAAIVEPAGNARDGAWARNLRRKHTQILARLTTPPQPTDMTRPGDVIHDC